METAIRAVRKHRKDGLQETLSEAIDILYRRKILNSLSKKTVKNSTILTRRELRSRAKNIDKYYELSNSDSDEIHVPRKRDVPSEVPIEEVEPDDYGPSFVTLLEDTTVLGPAGIGRSSDGNLIADTVARPYHAKGRLANGISRSMKSFGPRRTQREIQTPGYVEPTKQFEVVCPLIQMWGKNYYHWTGETLTKLRGVEHLRERLDIEPTLLIPRDPTSWMLESLKLLGYDENDVLRLSDFVVSADKLVVPSYPDPSASDLRWLKSRMVSGATAAESPDMSKRLFVTREDATRRRIKNIEAVTESLQERGFEPIDPGNYSVAEQVQIFNGAEVIVGAHGAGLTNMIYSDDVEIIELFGQRKRTTFYRIAQLLNHDYRCLENEKVGVDIRVDISKLCDSVDRTVNSSY